jgi:Arc/MetJ-type ribon-helix-helix transcriptional regulator
MGNSLSQQASREGAADKSPAAKRKLEVVTLRLPQGLIDELDGIVQAGEWASRSELVRRLLVVALSVGSPEAHQMEQAIDEFLAPLMPRVLELLGEIVKQIPREMLEELLEAVAGPISEYFSRVMGIPAGMIRQNVFGSLPDLPDFGREGDEGDTQATEAEEGKDG